MKLKMPTALGVGLALAALIAAGTAGADPAPTTPALPTPAPPAPAPGAPHLPAEDGAVPAAPVAVIDKDGIYKVGSDIVPGVYASAGPIADGVCYWRRNAAPTPETPAGEPGETLDRAMTKQPQVVQILPTDATFKTSECQTWQLTDAPPPAPGLPAVIAGLQMKGYLDTLNRNAAQYDGAPPPPPQPAP